MNKRKKILYCLDHTTDLKLIVALSRVTNEHNRQVGGVLRRHGLTLMQFAALEALYHKGSMKIGEIIEKVLSTGGNMTVVIKNLERDGLVERVACPKDSRAWLISITERGAEKMRQVFPEYLSMLHTLLAGLPVEDKTNTVNVLKKLRQ